MTEPAPRFLALGDSYTIGEGVAPEERWPSRLAARLRAEGVPLQDPEVVAVTGWTTDELAGGLDAAEAGGRVQGRYALVTLLVGVN
ncbi:MAG: GDSL-type esterase/lipase family protein, partial [Rubricoccaceae bacterium]|nr:GDSL-type esterase/lipase family protein [Rubricoccaceae bacterium]